MIRSLATMIGLVSLMAPRSAFADDQPQWGQKDTRNMVSSEKGLVEKVDVEKGVGVKWSAKLGTQTYATPVIANGRVFIGTNNEVPRDPAHKLDAGVLLCLDEKDGSMKWQLVVPKLEGDMYLDWPKCGWHSPVTVEGDRVYTFTNRAEAVCLDINGMANGNDGPFKDEGRHMTPRLAGDAPVNPTDGDILWLFDMVKQAGTWPHDGANAAPLIDGEIVYYNTNNGLDNTHHTIRRPDGPCLVALEKNTGRLIGRDEEKIGDRIVHNTWSSPAIGVMNGKKIVVFAGPDGIVYGFEALKEVPPAGEVIKLKKLWWFDCDPEAPHEKTHDYMGNRKVSPSTILAMPVFVDGKVYVTATGDIWWGKRKSMLKCIDASGHGDVTKTHQVWSYDMAGHCVGTCAVTEDLVYLADVSRNVHCIDRKTGQAVWTHKTGGDIWGSVLVADGKVYIGNRRGEFWILAAGREFKMIGQADLGSPIHASATAANGVVYIATMEKLWALAPGAR